MNEPCISCPFRDDNHEEFGVIAKKLCEKFNQPEPDFFQVLPIRENVRKDAISTRRLQCHCTVYDSEMNADPKTSEPCAGLEQFLESEDNERKPLL